MATKQQNKKSIVDNFAIPENALSANFNSNALFEISETLPETETELIKELKILHHQVGVSTWLMGQRFNELKKMHKSNKLSIDCKSIKWPEYCNTELNYNYSTVQKYINVFKEWDLETIRDVQFDQTSFFELQSVKNEDDKNHIIELGKSRPIGLKELKKILGELETQREIEFKKQRDTESATVHNYVPDQQPNSELENHDNRYNESIQDSFEGLEESERQYKINSMLEEIETCVINLQTIFSEYSDPDLSDVDLESCENGIKHQVEQIIKVRRNFNSD